MSSTAYESALKAATPSAMTAILIMGSFPLEVLLTSTLRGGKTKVGPNKGRVTTALNRATLTILKGTLSVFLA